MGFSNIDIKVQTSAFRAGNNYSSFSTSSSTYAQNRQYTTGHTPDSVSDASKRSRFAQKADRINSSLDSYEKIATATRRAVDTIEEMETLLYEANDLLIQAHAETDADIQQDLLDQYNIKIEEAYAKPDAASYLGMNYLNKDSGYDIYAGGIKQSILSADSASTTGADAGIDVPIMKAAVDAEEAPPEAAGLVADYYRLSGSVPNLAAIDFTATPDFSEAITDIDYNRSASWGSFWAGGPNDHFATRITGTINFAESGDWTMATYADDGVQVYIDGNLVVNDDFPHAPRWRFDTVNLDAGTHEIEVIYFENRGNAVLELHWEPPSGGGLTTVDETAFNQPTIDNREFVSLDEATENLQQMLSTLRVKKSELQTQEAVLGGQQSFYTELAGIDTNLSKNLGAISHDHFAENYALDNLREELYLSNQSILNSDISGLLNILKVGIEGQNSANIF